MNSASLADLPVIKAALDTAIQEILAVTRTELSKAIIDGRCLYDHGVALIYRRNSAPTYYGVKLEIGAYQVMQLIAQTKGDGSASKFMQDFLAQHGKQVYLLVKSDNQRAIRFYEKHGFTRRKTVDFKTFSSYLMVRDGNH